MDNIDKYIVEIINSEGYDHKDSWFKGIGWYYLDETWSLNWGGNTEEKAIVAFSNYVKWTFKNGNNI